MGTAHIEPLDDDLDDDFSGDDDLDDDTPGVRPALPTRPAHRAETRLVLDAGERRVETHVYLEGSTVRVTSTETHPSPEAAEAARDAIEQQLAGQGYKRS